MPLPPRMSPLHWLDRLLVPLRHPGYRRLMIRCYCLSARLEMLCFVFAVVSPFATPGMLWAMRDRFDRLARDVAEFGRLVRAPRSSGTPPVGNGGDARPRNPWL